MSWLSDEGYQVRFVRGAGVKRARWGDVDDAVTADVAGAPCVVLRLKDGRTTSIPVEVLAVERDAFVRDVKEHLTRFGIGRQARKPMHALLGREEASPAARLTAPAC